MSNTIIEAMASGLPVVATRAGANPESVVDGETGYLVPVDDTDALAEALKKLSPAEVRSEFSAAARKRIETEFSIDKMVQRYTDLYLRLHPHVAGSAGATSSEPVG